MPKQIDFFRASGDQDIDSLKKAWLQTLSRPQDGMWEAFRDMAILWGIKEEDKLIGYACMNADHQLIQFYISPEHLDQGPSILQSFLRELMIKTAIVGTNNPVFLSLATPFIQEIKPHSYLYEKFLEVEMGEREAEFRICHSEDLEAIVRYCHLATGGPEAWLEGYIGNLIEKGEIFMLRNEEEIIGTCEVRKSISAPDYVDIGMIVSPNHRKKGYGSFLLNRAKEIAISWGKEPICSTTIDNLGSQKAIRNCGFRSMHQLLEVHFDNHKLQQ
ncbi:MAG: GNAT family N-acetyltransferase [Bacteroidia bacterium]|nr:GNAT family N-acetyltransferase [Bacteroidia bacterium]